MSADAMRKVWAAGNPWTPAEVNILVRLAWFANDDGANARPSKEQLAKACKMWPRSVQTILHRLTETGALEVQQPASGRRPTVYRLRFENFVGEQPGSPLQDDEGSVGEQSGSPLQEDGDSVGEQRYCSPSTLKVVGGTEARGAVAITEGSSGDHRRGAAVLLPISTTSTDQKEQGADAPDEEQPTAVRRAPRTPDPEEASYQVVEALGWDVFRKALRDDPDLSEAHFADLLKQACVTNQLKLGPHSDKVHRAARSITHKVEKAYQERQQLGGLR